jgi:hypothetical protein
MYGGTDCCLLQNCISADFLLLVTAMGKLQNTEDSYITAEHSTTVFIYGVLS